MTIATKVRFDYALNQCIARYPRQRIAQIISNACMIWQKKVSDLEPTDSDIFYFLDEEMCVALEQYAAR